jgi:hypothetical protein
MQWAQALLSTRQDDASLCRRSGPRNKFLRASPLQTDNYDIFFQRISSRRTKAGRGPNKKPVFQTDSLFGTPGRIRTYDLWLRKPTLYPAELRVLVLLHARQAIIFKACLGSAYNLANRSIPPPNFSNGRQALWFEKLLKDRGDSSTDNRERPAPSGVA